MIHPNEKYIGHNVIRIDMDCTITLNENIVTLNYNNKKYQYIATDIKDDKTIIGSIENISGEPYYIIEDEGYMLDDYSLRKRYKVTPFYKDLISNKGGNTVAINKWIAHIEPIDTTIAHLSAL
jgi:hypothetical protein